VPRTRFHGRAASLLLELGIHPKVVSEMLGHSRIGTTLDLYSHVSVTIQQQAAAALDGLLGGQPVPVYKRDRPRADRRAVRPAHHHGVPASAGGHSPGF
jgi:hypothetical protein